MKPRKLWMLVLLILPSCRHLMPGAYAPPPPNLLAECQTLLPFPDKNTCLGLYLDLMDTQAQYEICASRHSSLAKAVSK